MAVTNVTMSPIPGYTMPYGPTASETWAAQANGYDGVVSNPYSGYGSSFVPNNIPYALPSTPPTTPSKKPGNSISSGSNSGGGWTNPNTGGNMGPESNDPLSPYNTESPYYDPNLGNANPSNIGVTGATAGAGGITPGEAMGLSGAGNIQDYFQQIYPETVMHDALRGMGGSVNIADPVMQQLNRMGAGMTYLFPLMGGSFDVSQFDPFVTGMTQGLMGGGGGSMNYQDLSNVFGNIFGGGDVADLMFADAYGPQGARSAADIIQNILGTALPTAMPLPLIGGVNTMLQQGLSDYIDSYVGGIGPGMDPQNFIDFLGQQQFGSIFGM